MEHAAHAWTLAQGALSLLLWVLAALVVTVPFGADGWRLRRQAVCAPSELERAIAEAGARGL